MERDKLDPLRQPDLDLVRKCMFVDKRDVLRTPPYEVWSINDSAASVLRPQDTGFLPVRYTVSDRAAYDDFLRKNPTKRDEREFHFEMPQQEPNGFAWISAIRTYGTWESDSVVVTSRPQLHIPAYIAGLHLIANKDAYLAQVNRAPPLRVATHQTPTENLHSHLLHIIDGGIVIRPRTKVAQEHDLGQTIVDYAQNLQEIGIQVMTSPGFAEVSGRMMRLHLPDFQQFEKN